RCLDTWVIYLHGPGSAGKGVPLEGTIFGRQWLRDHPLVKEDQFLKEEDRRPGHRQLIEKKEKRIPNHGVSKLHGSRLLRVLLQQGVALMAFLSVRRARVDNRCSLKGLPITHFSRGPCLPTTERIFSGCLPQWPWIGGSKK
ncbi:hypothetical protein U1Q18_017516, partial [Sarracenia purpurea var. burkii]